MACDICGANTHQLNALRAIYQTDAIKQVCPDCETVINKHLSKVQEVMLSRMIPDLLKRFMRGRKARKEGVPNA